jgi:hypothetical protein
MLRVAGLLPPASAAKRECGAGVASGCRHVPGNLYRDKQGADPDAACNELVIRIQPKEAIYLKINNKVCACACADAVCWFRSCWGLKGLSEEWHGGDLRCCWSTKGGCCRKFIRIPCTSSV